MGCKKNDRFCYSGPLQSLWPPYTCSHTLSQTRPEPSSFSSPSHAKGTLLSTRCSPHRVYDLFHRGIRAEHLDRTSTYGLMVHDRVELGGEYQAQGAPIGHAHLPDQDQSVPVG